MIIRDTPQGIVRAAIFRAFVGLEEVRSRKRRAVESMVKPTMEDREFERLEYESKAMLEDSAIINDAMNDLLELAQKYNDVQSTKKSTAN